jgi:hypothetical protein
MVFYLGIVPTVWYFLFLFLFLNLRGNAHEKHNRNWSRVFNATLNNISVISWQCLEKTIDPPEISDKLDHIKVYLLYLAIIGLGFVIYCI